LCTAEVVLPSEEIDRLSGLNGLTVRAKLNFFLVFVFIFPFQQSISCVTVLFVAAIDFLFMFELYLVIKQII
jgi:hypothetical protein